MQASNILDLTNSEEKINSKISALKTGVDVLKSEKDLQKSVADSFQKSQETITSQLNKIKDLQKRFQRDPPNSMDQLLGFLGQTRGKNIETLKYLRRKILDVSASLEPNGYNSKRRIFKSFGLFSRTDIQREYSTKFPNTTLGNKTNRTQ